MTQEIGKVQVKTNSITANQDSGAIKVSVNSQNPQRVQSIQYFAGAETLQNISNQSNTAIALAAGSANTTASAYATANAGYATANAGYATANAGYSVANIALSLAEAAFAEANTDYVELHIVWNEANTAFNQANAAYHTANAGYSTANAAYSTGNSSYSTANAAYATANAGYSHANAAYTEANVAYVTGNAAYAHANASFDHANVAYVTGNAAYAHANAAYAEANLTHEHTHTAFDHANAAYETSNASYSTANAAYEASNASYATANAAYSTANAAYTTSNSSFATANLAISVGYFANTAWNQANSAYATGNVSYSTANASFATANAAYETSNASYATANAAYSTANAGYSIANASYATANASFVTANTKVNKSGDVMTGNLAFEIAEIGYHNALTISNTDGLQFVISNNGDLTAYGQANVYERLAVGTGAYFNLPDLIAQFTANAATYSQVNQQNINSDGSGDFVVTSDNGTDLSYYTDLGKAGSTYNYYGTDGELIKPNDSYLIAQGSDGHVEGSNLHIMTTTSGHGDIVFAQGGAYEPNEVARFKYGKGLVIETQTSSTSNSTGALVVEGGIGANGAIYADSMFIQNDDVANRLQSAFDKANTAYGTIFSATPAWGHANAAYDHANAAFDAANNVTDAAQLYTDAVLTQNVASANAYVNSAIASNVVVMNSRITSNVLVINTSINRLNVYAQGAYATANAALANTTGTFGGTLTVSEAIKVGTYVDFNNNISAPAHVEGRVFYDNDQKALAYYNESAMTGQILQEAVVRVWNNTANTIVDGKAVYVAGVSSANNFPSVDVGDASTYDTSEIIGITTTTIEPGGYGYATTKGKVSGLNTSLFVEGDELYLNNLGDGGFVGTPPATPNIAVRLGTVVHVDATEGSMLVDISFREGVNMTTGSLVFAYNEHLYEDPENLFWDYGQNRLGIGTNTPQANLHVVGSGLFTGNVTISGNLLVSNAQSITTTELTVGGNTIILNNELVGSPTSNAELIVNRGTENNVFIRWDESIKEWTMFEDNTYVGHILHHRKTATTWDEFNAQAPYERLRYPVGGRLTNNVSEHAIAGYITANSAFATGYYANTAWNQANAAYAQGNTTILNTNSYISSNVFAINSSIDANVVTINSSIDANVSNLRSEITANAVSANSVIDTNISANVAQLRSEITANSVSANSVIDTNISANVATLRGEITSNTNNTLSTLRGEITANSDANFAHANGAFNLANTSIQTLTGTDRVVVTQNDAHNWSVDLTTAATAGSYSYPQLTTDGFGRITTITSLTPVTTLTSNGQLTFSRANGAVFAGLANVSSSIGSYGDGNNNITIVTDGFGRTVSVSNTTPYVNWTNIVNMTGASGPAKIAIGANAGQTAQGNYGIALGNQAGNSTQGDYSVAIGHTAGASTQQYRSVAIGAAAGYNFQGDHSVAIGNSSGSTSQGQSAVAIGSNSGSSSQGVAAISIGVSSGYTNQGTYSIAIGGDSAGSSQGAYSIAMGKSSGAVFQNTYSVAIGTTSGTFYQGANSVALGANSAYTHQGTGSIAIGDSAGSNYQGDSAVAIGRVSGLDNQGFYSVAIGNGAGQTTQGGYSVSLGSFAGKTSQGFAAVSIGMSAGYDSQGSAAVAIGQAAGNYLQRNYGIAIGVTAGSTEQGSSAIAIGYGSGASTQNAYAISIGTDSGGISQGNLAIAIGTTTGYSTQGENAIAIGTMAGNSTQGMGAIAIGEEAGYNAQAGNTIAIGAKAGQTTVTAGSIILNASGYPLNSSTDGFFVSNVRTVTATGNVVSYNPATKEFTYTTGLFTAANVSNYVASTNTGDTGTFYPLFAKSSATGNNATYADAGISYDASTNALTATTFNGQAVRANTAKYLETTNSANTGTFYPLFALSSASGNNIPFTDSELSYNASTNALTAASFVGQAVRANTAKYLETTNTGDTGTFYPLFATASATGNNTPYTDAGISYNASTNALSASIFSATTVSATTVNATSLTGDLAGHADRATTARVLETQVASPSVYYPYLSPGGAGGNNQIYTSSTLSYDSSTDVLSAIATQASTLSQGGGTGTAMTFNYAGQSSQPTWLWGTNDGTNIYVWNPVNFSVAAAVLHGVSSRRTNGNLAAQGPAIFPYFGVNNNPSLDAASYYDIEFYCAFLKTTAGTATWTFTFSSAPTNAGVWSEMSPITGSGTTGTWGAPLQGVLMNQAATFALPATGSLTTAVNHFARFRVTVQTNAATSLTLNLTQSAGTATPLAGSYWRVLKLGHGASV